jgi:ribosome maturation factor RimP
VDLLRQPLSTTGLDVEAVEVAVAGRRRVVRVLVDKDGGVTLDDIAAASTVVSDSLDGSDLLGDHPYTLEVTSPGVDRPLSAPRHWRRNVGRLVSITRYDGGSLVGRIQEADEAAAMIQTADSVTRVGYDQVAKARVQVEFNRRSSAEEA